MPKWALNVMQLPPEKRSESDVKKLVSLLRPFKTFKDKFCTAAQEEFCRHCEYAWYSHFLQRNSNKAFTFVRYEKRRVLLRTGHPGQSFYFIYSGSAFVNIEEKASRTGKMYTKTQCVLPRGSICGVRNPVYLVLTIIYLVHRSLAFCMASHGQQL